MLYWSVNSTSSLYFVVPINQVGAGQFADFTCIRMHASLSIMHANFYTIQMCIRITNMHGSYVHVAIMSHT